MMTEKTERVPEPWEPRIYRANPRGIGNNWVPCMVCGQMPKGVNNDCSFFVPTRETGEAIQALFDKAAEIYERTGKTGWKLDYRPTEPRWIQLKIGACDEHLSNLKRLVTMVDATQDRNDGPGISFEMVVDVLKPRNRYT